MGTRAAIYTRISKDRDGTELGVERQDEDCRRLAERLGLTVVATFRDNDISASTLSTKVRTGYSDMLVRAHNGEFDTILAYSNSRLTRRPREYEELIELHRSSGVVVRTVVSGDHDLSTADGRAVARTIAAWDAAEAERASERQKRQKLQRAQRGEWHGGTPPYGYRSANTKLVRREDEAERILEAATRVLDNGESLHAIIRDWNAAGVPTRGGKQWRQSNLRSILMNRAMLGETKTGAKGWEPILDDVTFDRLHALFSDPSRKSTQSPGVKGGKYSMGGGLARCFLCDRGLTSQIRKTRDGATVTLVCSPQANPGGHEKVRTKKVMRLGKEVKIETISRVRINHAALEAEVLSQLIAHLDDSTYWHQRLGEPKADGTDDFAKLRADRAELEGKKAHIEDLLLDERVSKERAYARLDGIMLEIARIDAEANAILGRAEIPDITPDTARELLSKWPNIEARDKQITLRKFIKKVVVKELPASARRGSVKDRIDIDWTIQQWNSPNKRVTLLA